MLHIGSGRQAKHELLEKQCNWLNVSTVLQVEYIACNKPKHIDILLTESNILSSMNKKYWGSSPLKCAILGAVRNGRHVVISGSSVIYRE